MDAENIRAKVKKVFFDLFQKDESKIQDSYCTDNFFGSKMGLLPGDVVAYLYAVEKEFNLQIPSSYIQEGNSNWSVRSGKRQTCCSCKEDGNSKR